MDTPCAPDREPARNRIANCGRLERTDDGFKTRYSFRSDASFQKLSGPRVAFRIEGTQPSLVTSAKSRWLRGMAGMGSLKIKPESQD